MTQTSARRQIERLLAREAATRLITAGYALTVNDGEDDTLKASKDVAAVLLAMFTTDEDWLIVLDSAGTRKGWVRFIYGNDGYDVVNDYTVNLEPIMSEVNKVADKLESGDFSIRVPA